MVERLGEGRAGLSPSEATGVRSLEVGGDVIAFVVVVPIRFLSFWYLNRDLCLIFWDLGFTL